MKQGFYKADAGRKAIQYKYVFTTYYEATNLLRLAKLYRPTRIA